jgi:hypothetical protein
MLASALVLAGAGVFFAVQDLGTANEYASIASFFLALLTAAGSLLSLARAKTKQSAATSKKPRNTQSAHGPILSMVLGAKVVQYGANSSATVNESIPAGSGKKGRRTR